MPELITEAKFLEKIFLSLLGGKKDEIEAGLKNVPPKAIKELKDAFDNLDNSMHQINRLAKKYGTKQLNR